MAPIPPRGQQAVAEAEGRALPVPFRDVLPVAHRRRTFFSGPVPGGLEVRLRVGAEPGPEEAEFPEHVLANGQPMTEANVRAVIEGFRSEYPEGMEWTNDNFYQCHALRINGYGCVAFALICSDAAFGDLPVSRKHSDFDAIRAGDTLRVNGNTHTVIVLEKKEDSVIIAEGNYNGAIPAGKGKVEITCPKCGGKIIGKS